MKDKNNPGKSKRFYWGAGILILALIATGIIVYYPWAPLDTPTTAKATTTFTLIDYNTGEDVSAWVEISVFTPDEDDLPFDEEDPYRITNFDEEESSTDAADVTIDLRDHAEAWLEIDPDFESDYGGYNGVYNALTTRDFRKLYGGANYDYRFYVYHAPSNVSVAILEQGPQRAGSNIGDLSPYNNTFTALSNHNLRGMDGNYTIYLNMPYGSTDAYHAGTSGGDEWDIDDDELDDIMTDAALHDYDIDLEMNWLQDQSNFRTIAPYYDLTDDINKEFDDNLERATNTFAVRFGFNASVSVEDGNEVQVNLTIIDRDYNVIPAEVIYDAEYIYAIFYTPITVYNQLYSFDIELEFGTDVWMGNVTTVRVETPDNDDNLGTATVLNDAWMDIYAKCG